MENYMMCSSYSAVIFRYSGYFSPCLNTDFGVKKRICLLERYTRYDSHPEKDRHFGRQPDYDWDH